MKNCKTCNEYSCGGQGSENISEKCGKRGNKMTLEEAINFYKESAKRSRKFADACSTEKHLNFQVCRDRDRAEECEQLVEWLTELKAYRKRDRHERNQCSMINPY